MWFTAFSVLAQLFTNPSVQIKGDVSDLKFETLSQSADQAEVRVHGELRVAVLGSAQAQQVDERWPMVWENETWRWCGSGTGVPVLAPTNTPAQPIVQATPTPAAAAVQSQELELVGQFGGVIRAVFVEGQYAYIGQGPRLTILDISNPASPTVVGQTSPFSGLVRDVFVASSTAYVTGGEAGLWVVDVSNPARPRWAFTTRWGMPGASMWPVVRLM
jgi:hypothetical protein